MFSTHRRGLQSNVQCKALLRLFSYTKNESIRTGTIARIQQQPVPLAISSFAPFVVIVAPWPYWRITSVESSGGILIVVSSSCQSIVTRSVDLIVLELVLVAVVMAMAATTAVVVAEMPEQQHLDREQLPRRWR